MAAFTNGTVYAVELVPELQDHHRAREAPANVRFVAGDVTHLDLPPASADVAVSIATHPEDLGGNMFAVVAARTDVASSPPPR